MSVTTMPKLLRASVGTKLESLDEKSGEALAFVSSLDVLNAYGEMIGLNAFDSSIVLGGQVVCWVHQWDVIDGIVVESTVRDSKLLARMQFDMDDPEAAKHFSKVKRNYVREWSVGFYPVSYHFVENNESYWDTLVFDEVDWVEVSPVLRGASPNTQTIEAHARNSEIRQYIKSLEEDKKKMTLGANKFVVPDLSNIDDIVARVVESLEEKYDLELPRKDIKMEINLPLVDVQEINKQVDVELAMIEHARIRNVLDASLALSQKEGE